MADAARFEFGGSVYTVIDPKAREDIEELKQVIGGGGSEKSVIERVVDLENEADSLGDRVTALEDGQAEIHDDVAQLHDAVDGIDETLEAFKRTDVDHERRITNLEYASRGVLYREDTDTTEAYEKDIQSDVMPYATLDSISGKTIVMNQLLGETGAERVEGEFYEQEIDKKAVSVDLSSIGAKSIVWNSMFNNVDVYQNNGIVSSVKNNIVFNASSNSGNRNFGIRNFGFVQNHKFYVSMDITYENITDAKYCSIAFGNLSNFHSITVNPNVKTHDAFIGTNSVISFDRLAFYPCGAGDDGSTTLNATFRLENVKVHDLTAMFGSTIADALTVEDCERIFKEDYYPYSEPTLMNVNADEVVVKGKNLFDGVPYKENTYFDGSGKYIGNDNTDVYGEYQLNGEPHTLVVNGYNTDFSDTGIRIGLYKGSAFSRITLSLSPTTMKYQVPSGYDKMIIFYYKSLQPQISIVKGMDSSYSPYFKEELSMSSLIRKYFPTGMKSAGSVHDVFDVERGVAVQNVGSATMNALNWNKVASNNTYYALVSNAKNGIGAQNCECDAYYKSTGGTGTTISTMGDMIFAFGNTNNYVYVGDSSVETVEAFKTKLNEKSLYYELATPIETPIDPEDLALLKSIPCEEGGTITFQNSHNIALPIPVADTFEVTEWNQSVDSTHKYLHNAETVTGASSIAVASGDKLIDLTKAFGSGKEPIKAENIFFGEYAQNDGELVSADVDEVVIRGRNLWDVMNPVLLKNTSEPTKNPDGSFHFEATLQSGFAYYAIDVTPGDTYRIVCGRVNKSGIGMSQSFAVCLVHDGDTEDSPLLLNSASFGFEAGAKLFTPTKSKVLVRVSTSGGNGGAVMDVYSPQIWKTNFNGKYDDSMYLPYHEPTTIPLASIVSKYFPDGMKSAGSVYDALDIENGVAIKNVGEKLLDGSKDVEIETGNISIRNNSVRFTVRVNDKIPRSSTDLKIVSDYVTLKPDMNWNNDLIGISELKNSNMSAFIISIPNIVTTIKECMDYLSNNNITVYYELAEPIITPIDKEDLDFANIKVEANGALTFKGRDDIHIPIPNKESYLIKTGGA